MTDFMATHGGDVSIYIETVDGTYSYGHGSENVRRTASSIKLPFIAYVMTLVDQKQLDLNTELTYTAGFKIDGTGIIQFEPIGTTYTIGKLAELVIRYSDNVAYLMLLNHVGEQQFIQFLYELDPLSPNNRVFSTPRILSKAMKYVHDKKIVVKILINFTNGCKTVLLMMEWLLGSLALMWFTKLVGCRCTLLVTIFLL